VITKYHVCEGKDVGGTEGGFGVRALLLAAEQSVAWLIQGANKELKINVIPTSVFTSDFP